MTSWFVLTTTSTPVTAASRYRRSGRTLLSVLGAECTWVSMATHPEVSTDRVSCAVQRHAALLRARRRWSPPGRTRSPCSRSRRRSREPPAERRDGRRRSSRPPRPPCNSVSRAGRSLPVSSVIATSIEPAGPSSIGSVAAAGSSGSGTDRNVDEHRRAAVGDHAESHLAGRRPWRPAGRRRSSRIVPRRRSWPRHTSPTRRRRAASASRSAAPPTGFPDGSTVVPATGVTVAVPGPSVGVLSRATPASRDSHPSGSPRAGTSSPSCRPPSRAPSGSRAPGGHRRTR